MRRSLWPPSWKPVTETGTSVWQQLRLWLIITKRLSSLPTISFRGWFVRGESWWTVWPWSELTPNRSQAILWWGVNVVGCRRDLMTLRQTLLSRGQRFRTWSLPLSITRPLWPRLKRSAIASSLGSRSLIPRAPGASRASTVWRVSWALS